MEPSARSRAWSPPMRWRISSANKPSNPQPSPPKRSRLRWRSPPKRSRLRWRSPRRSSPLARPAMAGKPPLSLRERLAFVDPDDPFNYTFGLPNIIVSNMGFDFTVLCRACPMVGFFGYYLAVRAHYRQIQVSFKEHRGVAESDGFPTEYSDDNRENDVNTGPTTFGPISAHCLGLNQGSGNKVVDPKQIISKGAPSKSWSNSMRPRRERNLVAFVDKQITTFADVL